MCNCKKYRRLLEVALEMVEHESSCYHGYNLDLQDPCICWVASWKSAVRALLQETPFTYQGHEIIDCKCTDG